MGQPIRTDFRVYDNYSVTTETLYIHTYKSMNCSQNALHEVNFGLAIFDDVNFLRVTMEVTINYVTKRSTSHSKDKRLCANHLVLWSIAALPISMFSGVQTNLTLLPQGVPLVAETEVGHFSTQFFMVL